MRSCADSTAASTAAASATSSCTASATSQPGGHRLHLLERAAGQHLLGALGGKGAGDRGDQAAAGPREEHPLAVKPARTHTIDHA